MTDLFSPSPKEKNMTITSTFTGCTLTGADADAFQRQFIDAVPPEPKRPADNDAACVFEEHARWVAETTQAAVAVPNTKSFSGSYLLFRKDGQNLKRGGGAGAHNEAKAARAHPPRFRHPTFAAAEKEAGRLLGFLPESTFVILQEVARVKLKPAEALDG